MPPKSKKRAELDRLRGEHNKMLTLEIILVLAAIAWFFAVFYVYVFLVAWLGIFIALWVVAGIFDYKRKRLARKIDTAEGVIAARET